MFYYIELKSPSVGSDEGKKYSNNFNYYNDKDKRLPRVITI